MTTKITKKFPILTAFLAVAAISVITSIDYIMAENAETRLEKIEDPNQQLIAKIDAEQSRIAPTTNQLYAEKMLQEESLYDLGPNWEIVAIDYSGSVEPFETRHITVYARLLQDEANARQCEYVTEARIVFDAKTGNAVKKSIPAVDSKCVPPETLGPVQKSANIPDIIQQAVGASDRAFLIAEQGSPSGHYGGYVSMKIPTLDEDGADSIYEEMDEWISFTYNQLINTEFFQVGWVVTTNDDFTHLSADDKYLVYVDTYTDVDPIPRPIPEEDITWSNNGDATVYIQCGSFDDYFIYMNHNGGWFTHDTNYDCDNTTDNSSSNNSVFMENQNTVASSEWEDEITTDVKAWSAREFETKTTTTSWDSSENAYENCPSGTGLTNSISGNLELGGTATWDPAGIDDC